MPQLPLPSDAPDAAGDPLRRQAHALSERVKELGCLYGISEVIADPERSPEEVLRGILALIPPAWQHPETTCARIVIEGREYATEGFRSSPWIQMANIVSQDGVSGFIEVAYREERPAADEGPFLKEERSLLNVIAERVGRLVFQKRVEEALQAQQAQLKASERSLHLFSQRLLTIREEEKKEIAVTLHDELGAMAVALNARLALAEDEVRDGNRERALAEIAATREAIKTSLESLKAIAVSLRPPNLEILGLTSALREYLASVARRAPFELDALVEGDAARVPEPAAIALYRVAQEAVTNAIKHAEASRVEVSLRIEATGVELAIRDDGRGLRLDRAGDGSSIGLRGMRERIEALGGRFGIESAPDRGTTIRAALSLPEPEEEEESADGMGE